MTEGMDPYNYENNWATFSEVVHRLYDASIFAENIAYILLLLCVVDLGLSFLYVVHRSKTGHTIIMSVTGGFAVVLTALALGRFGRTEAIYTSFYNDLPQ